MSLSASSFSRFMLPIVHSAILGGLISLVFGMDQRVSLPHRGTSVRIVSSKRLRQTADDTLLRVSKQTDLQLLIDSRFGGGIRNRGNLKYQRDIAAWIVDSLEHDAKRRGIDLILNSAAVDVDTGPEALSVSGFAPGAIVYHAPGCDITDQVLDHFQSTVNQKARKMFHGE